MNKKLLVSALSVAVISLTNVSLAHNADVKAPRKPKCGCPISHIKKHKPVCHCPECIQAMKEKMEKELKLTDEQIKKLDKQRHKTAKKLERIRIKEKKLAKKRFEVIKAQEEFFLNTLTDEQKAELKRLVQERKTKMEQARKERVEAIKAKKHAKRPIKK